MAGSQSVEGRRDALLSSLPLLSFGRVPRGAMRLNYSLSTWNYEAYTRPASLEEAVADARRSGYGVEVWPSWKEERNLFGRENRERLVRLLADLPSSLHGGADARTLDDHKVQIEAARDTGSPVLVLHRDHIGIAQGQSDYGLARDVAAYARENGVTAALENSDEDDALGVLLRALDAVPDLAACLDIGHVYAAYDHPVRDYLSRLSSRIKHLHLQDVHLVGGTRRAKNDSHRPPGQCDIPLADWQLLLSTLEKIDFRGFAVIEVQPFTAVEIAAQAAEFLESIGA